MTENMKPEDDAEQATHVAGLLDVVDVILGMNDIREELSRMGIPRTRIDVIMGNILSILTTNTPEGENTNTNERVLEHA